jgi:hypothetical protein
MDLASALSGLQQSQVVGAVQIKVARMILDNEQSQGTAAVQLIQAAVAGVNNAGNSAVAAATGLGARVDGYA